MLKKSLVSLIAILAISSQVCVPVKAQQLVGRIVASVNDDAITDFDIDARARLLLAASNAQPNADSISRASRSALNELIDERLKLQEAKKLNIGATDDEIKAAVRTIEKNNNKAPGGIFQDLTQLGVPIDTFIERIKASVVWRKLLRTRVLPQVKVAQAEVKDAIDRAENSDGKVLVRVAEIFIPYGDESARSKALEKAVELRAKAKNTNAFMQLAKLHSRAPTATVGGDLGEIQVSALDKKIGAVALELSPGSTSPPIEVSDGVYVIHLISKRNLTEINSGQEKVTLAQAFTRIPTNATVDEISTTLKQTVGSADTCDAFDAAAKQISSNQPPRIIDANIINLPEFVQKYVIGMEIGQQTPALRIKGGVVVLMMCDRKVSEPTSQSEQLISDSLQFERIERQAESYLRDLRRLALIEINR
jgi:peptidyl-prolyl cis-trans isomerase SurA